MKLTLTKEQANEFLRAYVNANGSYAALDKDVAEQLVSRVSQSMDNLYEALQNQQELKDNNANKPRFRG